MSEQRLQKILARAGVASRRHAEDLIRDGRVTVNGRVATLGSKADAGKDIVKVDGKRVAMPTSHHYYLLYKPRGYITSRSDPEGRPTVMDLISPRHRKALVPVGRLDYDSEGLILLTDDGEFAHRVAHPRFGCLKGYAVKVRGNPERPVLDRLREGIVIDRKRTARAVIRPLQVPGGRGARTNTWWSVEIAEGRTRQIRKMFTRIGHPVQRLRRVSIGAVSDPDLSAGGYRELTEKEVQALSGSPPSAQGGRSGARRRRVPGKS